MKLLSKSQLILWLIALITGLTSIIIYPRLPEQIPSHWNAMGQIDGYSGKGMIFFFAFLPLILAILLEVFPKIDPKKQAYEEHHTAYRVFVYTVVLFMAAIYAMTTAVALGFSLPVASLIKLGIGILFIVLGCVLRHFKHNYFFGIRTPWTLANEEVWRRTHRLGSYGYIAAGIFALISVFFEGIVSTYLMLVPLLVITLGIAVYSYIIFRQQ